MTSTDFENLLRTIVPQITKTIKTLSTTTCHSASFNLDRQTVGLESACGIADLLIAAQAGYGYVVKLADPLGIVGIYGCTILC